MSKCMQNSQLLFDLARFTSMTKMTSLSPSSLSGSQGEISTTMSSVVSITHSMVGSISGSGIQNKSFGSMEENVGEEGESEKRKGRQTNFEAGGLFTGEFDRRLGEEDEDDGELCGQSNKDANVVAKVSNISAFKGPDAKLLSTRSVSASNSKAEFSDVLVKARFPLQSLGLGMSVVFESPETSTTMPDGKKTEIERLRSSLAERLMLTEGAAIWNVSLKENKQKIDSVKVLCSNSKN